MTRIGAGQPIEVRPGNNIYTALTAVALVASIIAIVVMFVRAQTVFEGNLFM